MSEPLLKTAHRRECEHVANQLPQDPNARRHASLQWTGNMTMQAPSEGAPALTSSSLSGKDDLTRAVLAVAAISEQA
ncbi:hypothetical protein MTO96_011251 [Rhipicephalus appendiculatus]